MAKNDNQVKCPKTLVKATKEMNDRDYLNDLLASLKSLTKDMTTALTEASNETLFKELDKFSKSINEAERNVFELAWSKGWYTLETAEENKIKQKKQELQALYDELNK